MHGPPTHIRAGLGDRGVTMDGTILGIVPGTIQVHIMDGMIPIITTIITTTTTIPTTIPITTITTTTDMTITTTTTDVVPVIVDMEDMTIIEVTSITQPTIVTMVITTTDMEALTMRQAIVTTAALQPIHWANREVAASW